MVVFLCDNSQTIAGEQGAEIGTIVRGDEERVGQQNEKTPSRTGVVV